MQMDESVLFGCQNLGLRSAVRIVYVRIKGLWVAVACGSSN